MDLKNTLNERRQAQDPIRRQAWAPGSESCSLDWPPIHSEAEGDLELIPCLCLRSTEIIGVCHQPSALLKIYFDFYVYMCLHGYVHTWQ